jgi:hypothetical protein
MANSRDRWIAGCCAPALIAHRDHRNELGCDQQRECERGKNGIHLQRLPAAVTAAS